MQAYLLYGERIVFSYMVFGKCGKWYPTKGTSDGYHVPLFFFFRGPPVSPNVPLRSSIQTSSRYSTLTVRNNVQKCRTDIKKKDRFHFSESPLVAALCVRGTVHAAALCAVVRGRWTQHLFRVRTVPGAFPPVRKNRYSHRNHLTRDIHYILLFLILNSNRAVHRRTATCSTRCERSFPFFFFLVPDPAAPIDFGLVVTIAS